MGVDTTFEDRRARLITIPLLGIGIPHAAHLLEPLGMSSPAYWCGLAYFVVTSFVIWHGNRFIWLRLRSTRDRMPPLRRAALLVACCVSYTSIVLLSMVAAWYWLSGLPPSGEATRISLALANISVLFIVQAYETVDLIRQRATAQLAVERMARVAAEAEIESLKSQIDPHFLFNSLANLTALVEEDSPRAGDFAVSLAHLYRYIVQVRKERLVPLSQELAFVDEYASLLAVRYDGRIRLIREVNPADLGRPIPPVSLQILIENAVKHNFSSVAEPLVITIAVDGDAVVVSHLKHPTPPAESTGSGLRNLDERCRLLTGRGIEVHDDGGRFAVRLPFAAVTSSAAS